MTEVYVSPYALLPQTDSSGFPSRSEWGWKLPSCAYNNTQHPTSASVRERGGKRVRGGRCPTEGQKLGRCKQTIGQNCFLLTYPWSMPEEIQLNSNYLIMSHTIFH